jgi:formate-dependent nitrite reductase membrane component NrfD
VVGVAAWSDPLWTWIAPGLGLVFLALTGGLLIWDLEHPERFPLLFLRPQWRSWLVRGGFILMGYGGLLVAHMAATWLGRPGWTLILAWAGVPLAVAAGVYTAWLFAQARARDLWQSPLMPPHLLVQAMLAGAGAMALAARAAAAVAGAPVSVTPPVGLASGPAASPPGVVPWLDGLFALAALAHLLMVAGEAALPQVTSHARLAHHELTSGRFGRTFRAGLLLGLVALTTPWLDGSGPGGVGLDLPWLAPVAIVAGLVGLFLFEHAYVQAGQSVPLA